MGIASVVDTLNNSVAFINCFRPTEPTLEIKCAVEIEKQNLIASIGPIVNRPAAIAIEKKTLSICEIENPTSLFHVQLEHMN